MSSSAGSKSSPLRSEFAGEAGMQELVRAFVVEMPGRVESFRRAWEDADGAEVRRLAHRLKGDAAGHGFGVVGQAARALEAAMVAAEDDLEAVRSEFEALVALCGRASE